MACRASNARTGRETAIAHHAGPMLRGSSDQSVHDTPAIAMRRTALSMTSMAALGIGCGWSSLLVLVIAFRQPLADRIVCREARATPAPATAGGARPARTDHLTAADGTGARELYEAALAIDPDRQRCPRRPEPRRRGGIGASAQRHGGDRLRRGAPGAATGADAVDTARAGRRVRSPSIARSAKPAIAGIGEPVGAGERRARGRIGSTARRMRRCRCTQRAPGSCSPDQRRALEGRDDVLSDLLQQAQWHCNAATCRSRAA